MWFTSGGFYCITAVALESKAALGLAILKKTYGRKYNNIQRDRGCDWSEFLGTDIVRGVGQLLATGGSMLTLQ